jgi:hypothetical protein
VAYECIPSASMHYTHAVLPSVSQRPYIVPGSAEMSDWERANPEGWDKQSPSVADVGRPNVHDAASHGDVKALEELAAADKRQLQAKDRNGWQVSCPFY